MILVVSIMSDYVESITGILTKDELRDLIPAKDSILKRRIQRSSLFAKIYLYLCTTFNNNEIRIMPKMISRTLNINRTCVWEILEEMISLGYLVKHEPAKGALWYGPSPAMDFSSFMKMFVKQEFVDIARERLGIIPEKEPKSVSQNDKPLVEMTTTHTTTTTESGQK
jgi:hypothetical protein